MSVDPSLPAIIGTTFDAIPPEIRIGASRSIGNLVAGVFEIPTEKLRGIAARIREENRGKVALLYQKNEEERQRAEQEGQQALAEAKELGALRARARMRAVNDEIRQQANREEIAAEAIELLSDSVGTTQEREPPSDEWISKFGSHAEHVSDEQVQKLWACVLAGEIREPGSFGLRTLRTLSEMDRRTADDFQVIARLSFGDVIPYKFLRDDRLLLSRALRLGAAGIVQSASAPLSTGSVAAGTGVGFIPGRHVRIGFQGKPGVRFRFESLNFTDVGLELLRLLPAHDEIPIAETIAAELNGDENIPNLYADLLPDVIWIQSVNNPASILKILKGDWSNFDESVERGNR